MKILLLSAYTAASHQYWIDGLQSNLDDVDWTVLTLPPRHFNWRIRGNSLTWALGEKATLQQNYDCILATSMVDLSALRGMVPALTNTRTVVYFHENQFVYPPSLQTTAQQHPPVEPQLVNLYSALCAETVAFNSDYNRQTFLQGVETLCQKLPDGIPPGIKQQLQQRSTVLPVPLAMETVHRSEEKPNDKLHLVWNHRWEYDKGPAGLSQCLQYLPKDLPLVVYVVGQQFRQQPAIFSAIKKQLQDKRWLGHWGFIDNRSEYLHLLARADAVLSTALHDFQGLSVLEAYQLGCIPVVPDRLAYREFIPRGYRYQSVLNNPEQEARAAAEKIVAAWRAKQSGTPLTPMPIDLTWSGLADRYRVLLMAQ